MTCKDGPRAESINTTLAQPPVFAAWLPMYPVEKKLFIPVYPHFLECRQNATTGFKI